MRHLTRLAEPVILQQNHAQWTQEYLASGKPRPAPHRYGHVDIQNTLMGISTTKCFYCERKLKGIRKEIDHLIEVSERKDLAYTWSNLYLACSNCNKKLNNLNIPVANVLDPCHHSDNAIQDSLTFDEEVIRVKNNSTIGLQTIRKYRLDSDAMDHARCKALKDFYKDLSIIQGKMVNEQRSMTDAEIESLKRYAYPDSTFSLMFKVLLEKISI